jgi:glutamine synthetase
VQIKPQPLPKNKIDPGKPGDEDLYELSEKEKASIPRVCGSLGQALEVLQSLAPNACKS